MRDLVIVCIVLIAAAMALRRPWIGVLSWTWLSIMNPHRYAYGFSYDAPLAAIAAGSTLIGLLITRERDSPFKGPPVTWLCLFIAWFTLSWLLGLDMDGDYPQWNKVIKIDFMIFVGLALMRTKLHIVSLAWIVVISLALLGAKGGVFTILTGGGYRVWGPPGSFIEDNNEFALSLVMTIPLLRFLQLQVTQRWQKQTLLAAMLLCAVAALGSQSRGALLAIVAMAALLWWRGRSRLVGGMRGWAAQPWVQRRRRHQPHRLHAGVLVRPHVDHRQLRGRPLGDGAHQRLVECLRHRQDVPLRGRLQSRAGRPVRALLAAS